MATRNKLDNSDMKNAKSWTHLSVTCRQISAWTAQTPRQIGIDRKRLPFRNSCLENQADAPVLPKPSERHLTRQLATWPSLVCSKTAVPEPFNKKPMVSMCPLFNHSLQQCNLHPGFIIQTFQTSSYSLFKINKFPQRYSFGLQLQSTSITQMYNYTRGNLFICVPRILVCKVLPFAKSASNRFCRIFNPPTTSFHLGSFCLLRYWDVVEWVRSIDFRLVRFTRAHPPADLLVQVGFPDHDCTTFGTFARQNDAHLKSEHQAESENHHTILIRLAIKTFQKLRTRINRWRGKNCRRLSFAHIQRNVAHE